MIRTRVGYAGGQTAHPTYHSLGDHSEVIQVDFDPRLISYRDLLEVFWASHNPHQRVWSRQYMAAVFYQDKTQRDRSQETLIAQKAKQKGEIFTSITPLNEFYLAEPYHQKYRLRGVATIFSEFQAMYPNFGDLIASTAAARVNGYLGGYGHLDQLQEALPGLGLSPEGQEKLIGIATRRSHRLNPFGRR